ncbi:hypothetical protein [Kaarinaea lacus]
MPYFHYIRFNIAFLMLVIGMVACKDQHLLFPPVMDSQTRGYCGTCHMAYQPSMLPAASWRRMMNELNDHFDEKVTLSPSALKHISAYLLANAGDTDAAGEAGQIALEGLQKNSNLQRISAAPYFKREHRFLENRILDDWVGSVANCTACHVGAWVGDYKR